MPLTKSWLPILVVERHSSAHQIHWGISWNQLKTLTDHRQNWNAVEANDAFAFWLRGLRQKMLGFFRASDSERLEQTGEFHQRLLGHTFWGFCFSDEIPPALAVCCKQFAADFLSQMISNYSLVAAQSDSLDGRNQIKQNPVEFRVERSRIKRNQDSSSLNAKKKKTI